MIEYAIDAAHNWNPLIIASAAVAQYLQNRSGIEVLTNDAPERGMSHSLRLADAAIPRDTAIIVLLADKPLVTRELIARICGVAQNADVAYPVNSRGEPGHPVFFSAKAREKIHTLPDGDGIRALRDDASLTQRTLLTDDPGAFFDVDTAEQLS